MPDFRRPRSSRSRARSYARHHDGVDDVDHAVRLEHVGLRHLRPAALLVLQDDLAVLHRGPQLAAGDGRQLRRALAVLDLLHEVLGRPLAGDDVIRQHLGQRRLLLGLEQAVDRARRQLGERRVGRREHRERAGALQRVDQSGGLHRGDERGVVGRVDGVLDDVLGREHLLAADHRVLAHLGVADRGCSGDGERGGGHAKEFHGGLCPFRLSCGPPWLASGPFYGAAPRTDLLDQSAAGCSGSLHRRRSAFWNRRSTSSPTCRATSRSSDRCRSPHRRRPCCAPTGTRSSSRPG